MPIRTRVLQAVILILGLLLVYAAHKVISTQSSGLRLYDNEIELVRQLATSGDPSLSDVLDRSMVYILAGEFLMGSDSGRDNEQPQRLVYLDAFEIDRYEVINAQYKRFIDQTGRKPPRYWIGNDYPPDQADIPVVGVGWQEADAYCEWVGKRLPTEAEWEKACRGTDGRIYPWGDTWYPDRVNVGIPFSEPRSGLWTKAWSLLRVDQTASGMPSLDPVGTYLEGASPYGVMDMAGNASEWVLDWYNWDGYWDLPTRNPQGLGPPWNRCTRGSSWYVPYGDVEQGQFRSRCAARNSSHAGDVDARMGIRCARSIYEATP